MFVIILVLNFIACLTFSLVLLRRVLPERPTPSIALYEAVTVACLCFSVETWFFIEGLSLFHALKNPQPLAWCYFLSFLVLSAGIFLLGKQLSQIVTDWRFAPQDPFLRKIVLLIAVLIFLPLFFVAIIYPPCTVDSMSYHLPRILHWIQNGNVEMYPTNYPRQLYHQPFAEYLMFGWELFCGGDYFDNLVQLTALLGVLCLMCLLVRHFGGGGRCQMLACLMTLSSPIVIFEAPTTQTDIILTFFFFSFLYFGLKLSQPVLPSQYSFLWKERLFYAVCMGVSLGLSLNTKFSIAPFEIPFCLWFGLRYLKLYEKKVVPIFLLLIAGFLIFNGPFLLRNIQTCGNMFGLVEHQKIVRNLRFGPDVVFSNAVRNIGMQLMTPNKTINQYNKAFLIRLHHFFGITWADPQITYMGAKMVPFEYKTVFILDDYQSGNALIILLFTLVSFFWCSDWSRKIFFPEIFKTEVSLSHHKTKKSKIEQSNNKTELSSEQLLLSDGLNRRRDLIIFVWLIVFGFLLFSTLFRWQPFGSRLLLPNFLGSIPFIAIGLCRFLPGKRILQFIPLFLGISVLYIVFMIANSVFFNPMEASLRMEEVFVAENSLETNTSSAQPMIDRNYFLNNSELLNEYFFRRSFYDNYFFRRKYKYFIHAAVYMVDYLSIAKKIDELGLTKIGIALDILNDRWEYPFWVFLRRFDRDYRIEWVVYPEYLTKTSNYDPDFVPELIITDLPPDIIMERFEIEHAWKYENFVLVKIKGKQPLK